jgi:hypothetical protein
VARLRLVQDDGPPVVLTGLAAEIVALVAASQDEVNGPWLSGAIAVHFGEADLTLALDVRATRRKRHQQRECRKSA